MTDFMDCLTRLTEKGVEAIIAAHDAEFRDVSASLRRESDFFRDNPRIEAKDSGDEYECEVCFAPVSFKGSWCPRCQREESACERT